MVARHGVHATCSSDFSSSCILLHISLKFCKMAERGLLDKTVALHESQFGADKFVKTVGASCRLLAIVQEGLLPASAAAEGLHAIASKFSEARCTGRFCGGYSGILVELHNLIHLTFLGGWRDERQPLILRAQAVALIQFYAFEHASFLGAAAPRWLEPWLTPLGGADELGRRSCYGWGVFNLLDVAATVLKLRELEAMETALDARLLERRRALGDGRSGSGSGIGSGSGGGSGGSGVSCGGGASGGGGDGGGQNLAAAALLAAADVRAHDLVARARLALQLHLVRIFCFAVPTFQYCLRPGSRLAVQPDWLIAVMSTVECAVGYYALWCGYSISRPALPAPLGDDLESSGP